MAGKRTATSDLNHDNWDREEEPEESGSFKKASDDVLKSRTIRTAKRRNPIHKVVENESEEKPNIFGGVNFTKSSSTITQAPDKLFGFLSNLTSSSTTPKTNGTSDNQSIFNKDAMNTNRNESKCTATPNFTPTTLCSSSTGKTDNLENYYAKLKGLNQSVAKWINKHVDSNPLINLQPIFKDYEHFFTEIEKEKKNTLPTVSAILENKTDTNEAFAFKPATNIPGNTNQNVPSTSSSIFKFSSGESIFNKSSKIEPPPIPATQVIGKLSFGVPTISTPSLTTSEDVPKFSFGSSNVATSGFQFSANTTPFSFSNVSKPTTEVKSDKNKEGEESDEPPKVEVKEVEEEGQIYTIRCKVFVKKEGHFVERGVGNLYLKPVADSSKVQLIVRAYTNLGKLLCNFILSESIPLKRMGKNNVMLICVPTPEDNPPPTPVLLRVKSSEEADELLQSLEKHKN